MDTPKLPPGIYRIPLPAPVQVGEVNAYLLTGDVTTLVDSGPGTPEARHALTQGLQRIGVKLEEIWQVVITHPHVDHFGLAGEVAAATRARVIAHRDAVPQLADPHAAVQRTARALRFWGERNGIPEETLSRLLGSYIRAGAPATPVTATEAVDGGALLMAGSEFWRVVHTPGHSSGHICLLREGDGTLISGDHLLPQIPSSTLIEPTRQSAKVRVRSGLKYLVSLSQLMLLRIGMVLPGHGEPFAEAAGGAILQRIEAVRRRAERAYQHLCEKPLTIWQLSCALFPNTDPEMAIFALSNVAGYLDLLAANGRVVELSDTGTVRYIAIEALPRQVV